MSLCTTMSSNLFHNISKSSIHSVFGAIPSNLTLFQQWINRFTRAYELTLRTFWTFFDLAGGDTSDARAKNALIKMVRLPYRNGPQAK